MGTPSCLTRPSSAPYTRHITPNAGQAQLTPLASQGQSVACKLESTPVDMTLLRPQTQSVASEQPLNKNLPHFRHRDPIQSASVPQQGPRALFITAANPSNSLLHHLRGHSHLSVAVPNSGLDSGPRPALVLPRILTPSTQAGLFGSTPALASRITSLLGTSTSAAMVPSASKANVTEVTDVEAGQKDRGDSEVRIYHALSPAAYGAYLHTIKGYCGLALALEIES